MSSYRALRQEDDDNMDYSSAFDYTSIFTYSKPPAAITKGGDGKRANERRWDEALVGPGPAASQSSAGFKDASKTLSRAVTFMALLCSYILIFFTLPVSVWFCFKTLAQWERLVVYRLGKLEGIKGPGNVFLVPWLDKTLKLDLRTQLFRNVTKQFITRDQAIVEAGSTIHYRIFDPVLFVGNINDADLKGLKQLSSAISTKHMEAKREKEFMSSKSDIERGILAELNVITTPWGLEIGSVEIENFKVLQAAQPVNAFLDMMKQLGLSSYFQPVQQPSGTDQESSTSNRQLSSPNANRMQNMLSAIQQVQDGATLCIKICPNDTFYINFAQGQVHETSYDGKVDVTVTLTQEMFDALLRGATQSQFLQAYLDGEVLIEGDTNALSQLRHLLPNLQSV